MNMAIAIEINVIDGLTHYLNRLKHVVILIERYRKERTQKKEIRHLQKKEDTLR